MNKRQADIKDILSLYAILDAKVKQLNKMYLQLPDRVHLNYVEMARYWKCVWCTCDVAQAVICPSQPALFRVTFE